ncbi:MAG TPA: hypothetical protein VIM32_01560 [Desulfosporosinus sp.]
MNLAYSAVGLERVEQGAELFLVAVPMGQVMVLVVLLLVLVVGIEPKLSWRSK